MFCFLHVSTKSRHPFHPASATASISSSPGFPMFHPPVEAPCCGNYWQFLHSPFVASNTAECHISSEHLLSLETAPSPIFSEREQRMVMPWAATLNGTALWEENCILVWKLNN